ncbi:uncharacterized protein PITG_19542 [Phytophthora infestans T30-4]|uniref:Uncharacterized protein n=1 Tax=Phytophthora infestans (strain T30-4) TaxID=403677 RepID=D0P0C1_PHYIT|nr:uncharacterized protein PITG_19542 [Phytophthora infestans T30-4]EEY70284.1 hypothetical protein PITG_19542 [Phytophthora infestans T30-4]|eukprot:XP_002996940.1 hypothetical protein PITG_19542 [Phytophthora infestans T30-4]
MKEGSANERLSGELHARKDREARFLLCTAAKRNFSARQFKSELNLAVSARTIQRVLFNADQATPSWWTVGNGVAGHQIRRKDNSNDYVSESLLRFAHLPLWY